MNDLSHIYANSDLDEAQKNHGDLPHEAKVHLAMGFAHKAGLIPKHPGVYKGPPITPPEDWENSGRNNDPHETGAQAFSEGQRAVASQEVLSNLSQGSSPQIPSAPKAQKGPPPLIQPPNAANL